jgi:probable addiction module antidote protein
MPKRTKDHQAWLVMKLADPAMAARYLNSALEDSLEMFLEALRDVAQAKQMTKVARMAKVTRESLYKLTTVTGNPTIGNLYSVLRALDLDLKVDPRKVTVNPVRRKARAKRALSTRSSKTGLHRKIGTRDQPHSSQERA